MKKLTMAPPVIVADKALIASVIFTVPPQGTASIGQSDSVSLEILQREITSRLDKPVLISVFPHRVTPQLRGGTSDGCRREKTGYSNHGNR